MSTPAKVFSGFAAFVLTLGLAFLLPRVFAGNETGLAAGATAALVFLGCFAIAGVLGIVLLVLTLQHRATLAGGAKLAGLLPLPLLVGVFGLVVLLALQKQRESAQAEPPPKALVPTSPASP